MFDVRSEYETPGTALATATRGASLPESVLLPLLDLLASDDAYRSRFEADARAALRELEYETPACDLGVPGADPVLNLGYFHRGLASKAKIAAGRERWLALLRQHEQIFGPFIICA